MKQRKYSKFLFFAALLALLAGCSAAPASSSQGNASSASEASVSEAIDISQFTENPFPEDAELEESGEFNGVPADAVEFTGTVVQVETISREDPNAPTEYDILMEDSAGEQIRFSCSDETATDVPFSEMAPGDRFLVKHSSVTTRSLPPMSPAYQFSIIQTDEAQAASSQEETERLYVADAAMYRGVVQEFAVNDQTGNTVWILQQVDGTDFGFPELKVEISENTDLGPGAEQVGNGSYVEIFYGGKPDSNNQVEAIAVNRLESADMVIYNGVLKSIQGDSEGQMELESLDGQGTGYIFNFDANTQFYLNKEQLTPGTKLCVFHSAASTRSLPPQSAAYEVRLYVPSSASNEPASSLEESSSNS